MEVTDNDISKILEENLELRKKVKRLKKVEEELEVVKESFLEIQNIGKFLYENIDVCILVINKEGVCLLLNQCAADFFKKDYKDLIGKKISEIHHFNDIIIDKIKSTIESGVYSQLEQHEIDEKNKNWKEYNFYPVKDAEGNIYAAKIVVKDISKRKFVEEELRKSRRRYIDLINLLPIPVFEIDLKGKILFANKAAFEVFGYSPENIQTGIHIMEVFPIEEREKVKHFITYKNEYSLSEAQELTMQRENGDKFAALVYADPIIQKGKQIGLRGVVIDISKLKEYEGKINEQHEQLVLKTTQLEKSENELIELNNSKDVFFSIIAHELKSPFTSLLGITQLLDSEFEEFKREEIKKMITSLSGSAKGIFNLLEDLLGWAKLQTGRVEYNPMPVNLTALVTEEIKANSKAAINKNIAIKNKIRESIIANCDSDMIKTVLRNLIINGIKFTPDYGAVIISAEQNDEWITVEIADTGIGLTEEDMEKLFKIDIRATYIGKSSEKGTGIGLILCKELVEKNGGRIWVKSEPEKGSQFYFTVKREIVI